MSQAETTHGYLHLLRRRGVHWGVMHKILLTTACVTLLIWTACKSEPSAKGSPASASAKPTRGPKPVPDSVAYLAGGCFWGVEYYMEQLPGVASVDSGYMGGHVASPSYEQVSSHTTGHLETVRVRFDSKQVSFRQVAKRFFEIHDPTQANGQGPDIGPQYISAVFYTSDAQKKTAQELITQLEQHGYHVVTKLLPAKKFWRAEEYHQNHYVRKGTKPYCHARVRRFDKPIVKK